MKLYMLTTTFFFFLVVSGCVETVEEGQDGRLMNTELINSYNNMAVENAIISQHTLFPYHFFQNSAELNELGNRDLEVLAEYFTEYPGRLNIRRDGLSKELYLARVDFVLERLQDMGIDVEQIPVSDDMPGGSGMPSERVILIMEDVGKVSAVRTPAK